MLANGRFGSCGTFPRPFSTLAGSILKTCWREKSEKNTLGRLAYCFQRVVSAKEHKPVHQEMVELLIHHVFRIGCINEERLRVSSTDLHLESFNTFGQNQPALFYEQLISLDKTPFVWFYVPLSAQIEAAQELFSVSAGISVTLP